MVAEMLVAHGQSYIALDSDIDLVGKARRDGYNTRFGDVSRFDTLDRLGLDRTRALIITMDEPVLALRIAGARARRRRTCRSSPAPATQIMPPNSTRPAPAMPCPRPWKAHCNSPRRR